MEIANTLSFPMINGISDIDLKEVEQTLRTLSLGSESVVVAKGSAGAPVGGQPPALDAPDVPMVDFAIALMEVQSKMNQQQLEFSKNDIEAISLKNEAAHTERVSALEESIAKMEKAKKGGLFGKIFGWIATIATCIAAGAAAIATGGAAAAPLMLAAGLMLAQQISAECGTSLTEGIAKAIAPIFGEKVAQIIADVAFAITVIALTCGAGAATAAKTAADASSKLVQVANTVGQGARVTSGVSQVGQGASQAVATEAKFDADMYRADAKELAGFLAKMQALMNENTDRVQELLQRLQDSSSNIMAMMNSNQQSLQLINQNIRG